MVTWVRVLSSKKPGEVVGGGGGGGSLPGVTGCGLGGGGR